MTLNLITRLMSSLALEKISYCHWKSNAFIDKSLAGRNDLDLLIDKESKKQFENILFHLNFRQVVGGRDAWYPGIVSYYGHDKASGILVHVHAHFQMVLGHDLIKNFRLPLESIYLESVTDLAGMPVPKAELELIVFTIRMVLKRRLLGVLLGHPRDWFRFITGLGRGPLSQSEKRELDYLMERTKMTRLKQNLCEYMPEMSFFLFKSCLKSITTDVSTWDWLKVSIQLQRTLIQYQRQPLIKAILVATYRRFHGILSRVVKRSNTKMHFLGGGHIIAIVGGDGAGKTTIVNHLASWLGACFPVYTIHVGKPPAGALRHCLGIFFRLFSLCTRRHEEKLPKFLQGLASLLLARARYRLLQKALARRSRGDIVFLDRAPLIQHVWSDTSMESPRIRSVVGSSYLLTYLEKWENHYYERMAKPDNLIALTLRPEVAVKRKPEEDSEYVFRRNQAIQEVNWEELKAYTVDAEMPFEEESARIRNIVWSCMPRRQRIIEVVGPPATGKSTAINILRRKMPNIKKAKYAREHLSHYIKNVWHSLPFMVTLKFKGAPFKIIRTMWALESLLDSLEKGNLQKRNTCFVFDEGPIAKLLFLRRIIPPYFQKTLSPWLAARARQVGRVLDEIILLNASDDSLIKRATQRGRQHPIIDKPHTEALNFLEITRTSIKWVIENCQGNDMKVTRIDTEQITADHVAIIVESALER